MKYLLACLLLLHANWGLAQKPDPIPALKVEQLVDQYKNAKGVLVVNFWSTWCKPCIEEIPHFIAITKKYEPARVALLLVSLDTKALYESGELLAYVQKKKWQVPVVWLNETNADHYCPAVDSSWSGVIPATVIINPARNYYAFFEESLDTAALEAAIKKAMGE
jgi:thiol-disulfide isomerase/thioredoxin